MIKKQAENEGLDRIFIGWALTGVLLQVVRCAWGVNGDLVSPKQRCVSTSNRGFSRTPGPDARTHLTGPAMAAAAAVTGKLTDVRSLQRN